MIITSIHLIVLGERERLFAVAVVFVQFTKPTIMADWGVEHALAGMNSFHLSAPHYHYQKLIFSLFSFC